MKIEACPTGSSLKKDKMLNVFETNKNLTFLHPPTPQPVSHPFIRLNFLEVGTPVPTKVFWVGSISMASAYRIMMHRA